MDISVNCTHYILTSVNLVYSVGKQFVYVSMLMKS